MASITFIIPSVLNRGQGEKRLEMTADSIQAAFDLSVAKMGEEFGNRIMEPDGKPRPLINVYINGKNAKFIGGMEATMQDGDEVYILPAVAGGAGQTLAGRVSH